MKWTHKDINDATLKAITPPGGGMAGNFSPAIERLKAMVQKRNAARPKGG